MAARAQVGHGQVADSLEASGRGDPGSRLQRTVPGRPRTESEGRQVLLGVHPVPRLRDHHRRRLRRVSERHLPDILGATERLRAASGGLHVDRQRLGDRTSRLLGRWRRVGAVRNLGVHSLQQYADHHGVRTRTLLRSHGRHAALLRHDVRAGRQADAGNVRADARRTRTIAGAVLRGALHQDQPDIADLQPRSQGDGETTELHESAISAGHLLLPGRRPGDRGGDVDSDGFAAPDVRVPG